MQTDPRDKCFRCKKDLSCTQDRGHVTIAGYFSAASPAFYDSFILCTDCGIELDRHIHKYLFEETK